MKEKHPISPDEILKLKEQVWKHWEQLPEEHRASMTWVMIQTIMNGEYGGWLMDAWGLMFPDEFDER